MAIQARPIIKRVNGPVSRFLVQPGEPCDLVWVLADNRDGRRVDWSDHVPRFRIYSQYVDRCIIVEITDPERCRFEPGGVWKLHLTADETAALPHGGLTYTLEHQDSEGNWQLGIRAGISCRQTNGQNIQSQQSKARHLNPPHFNARSK